MRRDAGYPSRVLDLWAHDRFELVASPDILSEYGRVLTDLGSRESQRNLASRWLQLLGQHASAVDVQSLVRVCRDPHDDKYLACAIARVPAKTGVPERTSRERSSGDRCRTRESHWPCAAAPDIVGFMADAHHLPHCVYVLFSEADGKLYIGYTTDLKQRLTDHFNGRNQATALHRPLRLIYCEYHASTTDAHRREKYFKTTAGQKALERMLRDSLAAARGRTP